MSQFARRRAVEICRDLRCFVTEHLVGTDTWAEGYWCQCDSCMTVKRVAAAVAQVVNVGDNLWVFGERVRVLKIETRDGAKHLTVEKADGR